MQKMKMGVTPAKKTKKMVGRRNATSSAQQIKITTLVSRNPTFGNTSAAYILTLSKSNSPSLNLDAKLSVFSLSINSSEVPEPAVTVVLVTSVSSETVVAPTLRIVGADIAERANEGMGPRTDIRLGPSEVGDGSSSTVEMRPESVPPPPNAEIAGEMGPPMRRPKEEPERREPELSV